MGRGAGRLGRGLTRVAVGMALAAAVPLGILSSRGGPSPVDVVRAAVDGGSARAGLTALGLGSGADPTGIGALLSGDHRRLFGGGGARAPSYVDPAFAAPPGATMESLSLKGTVSGGGGALLAWSDGTTFVTREGAIIPGLEARVVAIAPGEVTLEQRVWTPEGESELKRVVLRGGP